MTARDFLQPGLLVSLPGIVAVAVVAARLLGVRRSLLSNVASGLLGWLTGVGLSTLIARGQPNPQAGFMRNVWVFSTVFTMSATVWLELLARPGTLARAQSGFSRPPRPLRALRRRLDRITRYGQITRIAVRYGLGPTLGLSPPAGPAEPVVEGGSVGGRMSTAVRVRRALEECGGVFVKLGQVLSTRSDLLPASACEELARLQDDVPPEPPGVMQSVLETEIGRPVEQVFDDFDWTPMAAGSIAQAYRARLGSGEYVVVKIQRPGIAGAGGRRCHSPAMIRVGDR